MSKPVGNVCVRCARSMRKGCCWADPKTRYTDTFGISLSDITRIVKATKKKPSEFLNVETISPELRKDLSMERDDLHAVMRGDLRLSLKSDAKGYCTLLGPQGCTMDRETRPRVCAIYPAHYDVVGRQIIVKSDALSNESSCLALQEAGESPTKLYRSLMSTATETERFAKKAHVETTQHASMTVEEIKGTLAALERS